MIRSLLLITLAIVTLPSLRAEDTLEVANLKFKLPEPWTKVATQSPMRAGTARITVEGSDTPLEAVFYYFGSGQGGDVDANIARWLGQFEGEPESKREEIKVGDHKVDLVIANGTYLDGPPFGGTKTPRPDFTLLGAIVPAADANVFIKLTGPKAAVAKAIDAFKKLSTSPF